MNAIILILSEQKVVYHLLELGRFRQIELHLNFLKAMFFSYKTCTVQGVALCSTRGIADYATK